MLSVGMYDGNWFVANWGSGEDSCPSKTSKWQETHQAWLRAGPGLGHLRAAGAGGESPH